MNASQLPSLLAAQRTVDLSALYEIEPGLCGMAMFVPIVQVDAQSQPILVDERRIYVGPSFKHHDSQEQAFLLAHSLLHYALKHPRRRCAIDRSRPFAEGVWNLAADAIVNDALSHVKSLKAPSHEVMMERIMSYVPAARTMSLEQLYAALLPLAERTGSEVAELIGALGQSHRLDVAEGNATDDSWEETTPEEWRERLKRGFGRHPAGFDRLLNHLPRSKTRWEYALRSLVAQAIGDREYSDPSRPHRRWLALHRAMRSAGVVLPIMPGTLPKPQPRVAVAIDTSGSIDTKLLSKFIAEIGTIMRQTGSAVRVITADAAVQQVRDFTRADELLAFVPAGGGGTNFDPAIDKADEYRPSVLVYFTDLVAPAPRKPRYPVVWAVPLSANAPRQPFGRRIDI